MTKKPFHNGPRNDDGVEYKLKKFLKDMKRGTLLKLFFVYLVSIVIFLLITVIRSALNVFFVSFIQSVPFIWTGLISFVGLFVGLVSVLYVILLFVFILIRLYDKLRKELDKKIVNVYFLITLYGTASLCNIDLFPSILSLASKLFLG